MSVRVFVVDDTAHVRKMLVQMLELSGFDVVGQVEVPGLTTWTLSYGKTGNPGGYTSVATDNSPRPAGSAAGVTPLLRAAADAQWQAGRVGRACGGTRVEHATAA